MNKLLSSVVMVALVMTLSLCAQAADKQSRFREGGEARTKRTSKSSANTRIVKEDGKNVIYSKKNVVDFDDSLIEGEVKNPSEFYFVHRPEKQFGSLVQKRKNFHKEMLRDSVMIR